MPWDISHIDSQRGKRFFITGANSGIGLEAATVLADKGAEVILAVRNLSKGQKAKDHIEQQHPHARVSVTELDLADLGSVEQCVAAMRTQNKPIDVLINNAGVMMFDRRTESAQGHEAQWATNHLGHFVLTAGLLPLLSLAQAPRIVTLSSLVAKFKAADIYYNDLDFTQSYDKMAAYAQSKLANVMFAVELQSRLRERGSHIISVAAHPGYTATNLQQHMGWLGTVMNALFAQSTAMGVLPTLRAATDPMVKGGEYFGPMKMQNYRGYPDLNTLPAQAEDSNQRKKLWQTTEEIVGRLFFVEPSSEYLCYV